MRTALLIAASLLAMPAFARIVVTSGDVIVLSTPPANVGDDVLESNDQIFMFLEAQNIALSGDLDVDSTLPGTALTPGAVGSGTIVNSYFVHFEWRREWCSECQRVGDIRQHNPWGNFHRWITRHQRLHSRKPRNSVPHGSFISWLRRRGGCGWPRD
ncbi:MAG: hypothetical protein ACI9BW_003290 [Gammaproteobacteria bacterium]|jgi:hypothetical protein